MRVYDRSRPFLYRGKVIDNKDPEALGKCKISVVSVDGELDYSEKAVKWARPIVLSPSKEKKGSVNIPDIGDIVWVFYEGADKNYPVYIGGTYAKGELSIDTDIIDFYIENEDRVSYDRKSSTYYIKIGDRQIVISPKNISIIGDTIVDGDLGVVGNISIKGDINSSGDISVGEHIKISASKGISVNSGGITVGGSQVAIKGLTGSETDERAKELGIIEEDLENLSNTEKKFYVVFRDIMESDDPDQTARSYGINVKTARCQMFVMDFYELIYGDRKGYSSALAAFDSTHTQYEIGDISIGAAIFGDSSAYPQYGHVAIYVGDSTVMHVVSNNTITIESLDELFNRSWFTYKGWGTYDYD